MKTLECKQCGGVMKKKVISTGNFKGILLALIVLIIGVALLFIFPIGTIIGLLLIIVALGMGGKRRKVWKCKNCGYIFERA